jgi:outer membrane immunogenic protein
MKKRLLGSVALPALLAGPAMAADLPLKAAPPPPAVFSWTGFYAGLNAGGAWGRSDATTSISCGPVPGFLFNYICGAGFGQAEANVVNTAGTGSMSGSGFTGGGQIGYNLQNNNWVYGVEIDAESFHLRASRQGMAANPGFYAAAITSSVSTDWLMTARGRVGWAHENLLAYVTGGVAATNLQASHTFLDNALPGVTAAWSGSATKLGWTVGGGLEYALSRNWSVKAEYLFVKFGSVSASGIISTGPGAPGYANAISTSTDLTAQIARGGFNYRF